MEEIPGHTGDDQQGSTVADSGPGVNFAKELQKAIESALKALSKPKCNSLFGLEGAPSAASVLSKLIGSDPTVGIVVFGPIASAPGRVTSATTVGYNSYNKDIGNGATQKLFAFTQVTINTTAGSFVNGNTRDQAVTLLHELGHVFSDLYGPQTTKIVSDGGDLNASQKNTKTIEDNCFK
jgi:hypothetical protein